MLCTFYGGYCSLWPNRTARSLSRAWPSLLRAHNHIGGATAVPLHHKKCLLCSVLIYIVLGPLQKSTTWRKIAFSIQISKLLTNFIRIGLNRNKEIRHSYEWLIPNKKHLQYELRKVGELLLFSSKFELTKRE